MSSLVGRRVVNTRAPHQAAEFDLLLRQRGALPVSYPCIELAPPADPAALDDALRAWASGGFDWLVVTSANTVAALRQRLDALALTPPEGRVAAVGPGTASALAHELGLQADLVPDEYVSDRLAALFAGQQGARIFLPQSALAGSNLSSRLADAGARVTTVDAYTMRLGSGGVALLPRLRQRQIDAIALTSGSTARYLLERLRQEGGDLADFDGISVVCIGPKTVAAAEAAGLRISASAYDYTLSGLVDALEQAIARVP